MTFLRASSLPKKNKSDVVKRNQLKNLELLCEWFQPTWLSFGLLFVVLESFQEFEEEPKKEPSTQTKKFHLWVKHVNFINQLKGFKISTQEPTKLF